MNPSQAPGFLEISHEEREQAIELLIRSGESFVQMTAGLEGGQSGFRASETSWTALEVAEHLATTEEFVGRLVRSCLRRATEPERVLPPAETARRDAWIQQAVSGRRLKVTAPEPVRPANRWCDIGAATRHFEVMREQNRDFLRTTNAILRDRFAPHPFLGPLDLFQWHLFLAAHTRRHMRQIEEIMACPLFPRVG